MRSFLCLAIILGGVLVVPAMVSAAPPSRPLALTDAQFDRLCELEQQSSHAAVVDVHASYKSDREKNLDAKRLSDDIFTAAYTGGFPLALLLVMIAAAPL